MDMIWHDDPKLVRIQWEDICDVAEWLDREEMEAHWSHHPEVCETVGYLVARDKQGAYYLSAQSGTLDGKRDAWGLTTRIPKGVVRKVESLFTDGESPAETPDGVTFQPAAEGTLMNTPLDARKTGDRLREAGIDFSINDTSGWGSRTRKVAMSSSEYKRFCEKFTGDMVELHPVVFDDLGFDTTKPIEYTVGPQGHVYSQTVRW
jgi:hypothetical protein